MFEAEFEALHELVRADAIRVPIPLCTGTLGQQAYIVMEYLDLTDIGSMKAFAQQLVKLHQYGRATSEVKNKQLNYGWCRDNTIGSTLQQNTQTENAESGNWITFWNTQRLGYQLELAKVNGANKSLLDKGERIQSDLGRFFIGYQPEVSLLHGDLWSGNAGFTNKGEPVIFDPAIYYGDRETDIAMTELFGGFSTDFYNQYQQLWPLHDGYEVRKHLYNLYHILNHFNMFGGSYAVQAEGICNRLLATI